MISEQNSQVLINGILLQSTLAEMECGSTSSLYRLLGRVIERVFKAFNRKYMPESLKRDGLN